MLLPRKYEQRVHQRTSPRIMSGQRLGSNPQKSGLAALESAREIRLAAGCENARLLDPVLALDPPLELEPGIDRGDVVRRPVRNLLVGGNSHGIEFALDEESNPANALQVLRG